MTNSLRDINHFLLIAVMLIVTADVVFIPAQHVLGVQQTDTDDIFDKPIQDINRADKRETTAAPARPQGSEVESDPTDSADSNSPAASKKDESKVPRALKHYMGREIARTMHYSGAPWLIRDNRERQERCSLMLANLGMRPQMVICDMGCGVGFHATQMAKMIGPKGYVAGVDVQPQMLTMMRSAMEKQGIENIVPILGSYHNPRLPRDTFDLVLMVDVYHEFSHPQQMLESIRESLKPDGLVVLVEFRAEDKTVPIKPEHKMSKAQVEKELSANGFKLVKSFDKLPWQHMLFYGRDDETGRDEAAKSLPTDQ